MRIILDQEEINPYRSLLVRNLVAYNDKNGPLENWEYAGFYALDEREELCGGIQGQFEWDWFHINHLWVKNPRQGLGRRLMQQLEVFVKEKGKRGLFVDTFAFQNRPFYENCGFEVFGTIEAAAQEHARYFLMKRFS
jgi:GNAT superfamily N-acetyltransferase